VTTALSVPPIHALKGRIAAFPYPFPEDTYRYSTNVEPANTPNTTAAGGWGATIIDIDEDYHAELAERATVLAADPTRHAVLPHMRPAAWDAMLTVMGELAGAYPDRMSLRNLGGDVWRWHNAILDDTREFRYGDEASLGQEPLAYITTQVQEDIALLDQRNEQLYVDAGVVTFAADWSFGFDVGMSFLEIHGPVPRVRRDGVITRAHDFLKRLQPHQPYRRTNWTLTIGHRLDVSTERYPDWGPDREMIQSVADDEFGRLVNLRVEVQHLIRLPDSGALMFLIRTYMLSLEELATVEDWRVRTAQVLAALPDDMAEYKGIIKYRDRAARWLTEAAPAATGGHSPREPVPGLPEWPTVPPAVDVTGASFLIVSIGQDPQTSHAARGWVRAAESAGPTRMLVLDSLAADADATALRQAYGELRTGSRILVTGSQYAVMMALAWAYDAGAISAELTAFVTDLGDLPMYCAHCRDIHRVVGAPGGVVTCPGCSRRVQIHGHHAPRLGGFLASAAAEEPS
jgi:hypothetical protein